MLRVSWQSQYDAGAGEVYTDSSSFSLSSSSGTARRGVVTWRGGNPNTDGSWALSFCYLSFFITGASVPSTLGGLRAILRQAQIKCVSSTTKDSTSQSTPLAHLYFILHTGHLFCIFFIIFTRIQFMWAGGPLALGISATLA
jgi:hypothetical protein